MTDNDLATIKDIIIEKGIPIPDDYEHRRYKRYPYGYWKKKLASMQVGDSFIVNFDDHGSIASKVNMAKPTGYRFTTRFLPAGIRVWRIE